MFALCMKSAAAILTVLTGLLTGLYLVYPESWCLTSAVSVGVTAYHFIMRLFIGWLVPAATSYRFLYRSAWFQPRSWEPKLYRLLHLRRLKNYLPTYDPNQYDLSQNTLHQIICHTCRSEIVHEIIMVLSFLPLVLIPAFGEPGVFVVTSLIAALADSLFVMAQRYNRPRLVRLYDKQKGCSV